MSLLLVLLLGNVKQSDAPTIQLPQSLFNNITSSIGLFFTFYQTAVFFPLAEGSQNDSLVGTSVIGVTIAESVGFEENITILFQLNNPVSFRCQ